MDHTPHGRSYDSGAAGSKWLGSVNVLLIQYSTVLCNCYYKLHPAIITSSAHTHCIILIFYSNIFTGLSCIQIAVTLLVHYVYEVCSDICTINQGHIQEMYGNIMMTLMNFLPSC